MLQIGLYKKCRKCRLPVTLIYWKGISRTMSKFFLDQSRSDAKFIVRRGVQCTVLTFSRELRDRSSRKPEARKETISLLSKVYFLARADWRTREFACTEEDGKRRMKRPRGSASRSWKICATCADWQPIRNQSRSHSDRGNNPDGFRISNRSARE